MKCRTRTKITIIRTCIRTMIIPAACEGRWRGKPRPGRSGSGTVGSSGCCRSPGLFSLVWFLLRVIPKPSRAMYPCQRLAMPLASGFVAWLIGLAGSVVAFRKAKGLLRQSRLPLAMACLVAALVFGVVAVMNMPEKATGRRRAAGTVAHRPRQRHPSRPGGLGPRSRGHRLERAGRRPPLAGRAHQSGGLRADDVQRHPLADGRSDGRQGVGRPVPLSQQGPRQGRRRLPARREDHDQSELRRHDHGRAGASIRETYAVLRGLGGLHEHLAAVDRRPAQAVDTDRGRQAGGYHRRRHPVPLRQGVLRPAPQAIPRRRPTWTAKAPPAGRRRSFPPSRSTGAAGPRASSRTMCPRPTPRPSTSSTSPISRPTAARASRSARRTTYGSLLRTPPEKGYLDLHKSGFSKGSKEYRNLVDLMGHACTGGKTVLYLLDGLYCGTHYADRVAQEVRLGALQRRLDLQPVRLAGPGGDRLGGLRFPAGRSAPEATVHGRARTTICTRRPWPTIRPPARSTIRTTRPPRHAWPASASTSTGTTRRTGSTPATSARMKGLSL